MGSCGYMLWALKLAPSIKSTSRIRESWFRMIHILINFSSWSTVTSKGEKSLEEKIANHCFSWEWLQAIVLIKEKKMQAILKVRAKKISIFHN